MQELTAFITNPTAKKRVNEEWDVISRDFETAYAEMPVKYMSRTELSFHPFVKLLGYLCLDIETLSGDIVEIGVWKGKSLAFMQKLSSPSTNIIGIDPFALPGQEEEVSYFHNAIFPNCLLIKNYSQNAIEQTLKISKAIKLLHIDGGHDSENVWADFLLYERFVIPGGYIVFDDYTDVAHSPEVGPAVDNIRGAGLFKNYDVIGQLPEYENSYVLKKRDND
ncbi:class I SAM-dependent methyltransferase [Agrobacterium fabrum]|uniref:class I SAM-dependent methyltransferase n=1 Tax=Agrobacterium fabrum TaxID=1176649 RepID=UPI00247516BE|nr:class I SAM-dependent methyltransferase [Agrobacterium fabrum]MDH6296602.1 hypothetical protein [Agrobacterium fabrum]